MLERAFYGDDMYSNEHNDYYDTKHDVRTTPHVLATPVHAEVPKQYDNTNENEDLLFVAVSYYLDEDECIRRVVSLQTLRIDGSGPRE